MRPGRYIRQVCILRMAGSDSFRIARHCITIQLSNLICLHPKQIHQKNGKMAVTLSAPAVDAAMAKQWGGGDRCPFASASSSLATIPADHPPIPLPTFEDHPVHVHTDDEVDDDTVHAHHHLPAADTIPSDPILYLPPLLSPLPAHLAHKHHDGPTEEELSSFDTHLPDIDPASLALHQALHHFAPVDNHYAARPYHTAFNWKAVGEHMDVDVEREWYCVVFRSRRNKGSESLDLYKADRGAHEEAVKNGGLILYWYGVPDSTGLNLATCIWQR